MRHPATAEWFEWDEWNEQKLEARGIRPQEVEGVWANRPRYKKNKRSGTATWMMVGKDPYSGKVLSIGVLWADEDARVLRAIHGRQLPKLPTK